MLHVLQVLLSLPFAERCDLRDYYIICAIYMSGPSTMALCVRNAHITVYDVTTWSWVNLVNPELTTHTAGTVSSRSSGQSL